MIKDVCSIFGNERHTEYATKLCLNHKFFSHSVTITDILWASFAKWYLITDVMNGNCTAGASTLFRKDVLDEHGGLKKFSVYLAEDFLLHSLSKIGKLFKFICPCNILQFLKLLKVTIFV